MIICPQCGHDYSSNGYNYCPSCGALLVHRTPAECLTASSESIDVGPTHIIEITSEFWKGWRPVISLYGHADEEAEAKRKAALYFYEGSKEARIILQKPAGVMLHRRALDLSKPLIDPPPVTG